MTTIKRTALLLTIFLAGVMTGALVIKYVLVPDPVRVLYRELALLMRSPEIDEFENPEKRILDGYFYNKVYKKESLIKKPMRIWRS